MFRQAGFFYVPSPTVVRRSVGEVRFRVLYANALAGCNNRVLTMKLVGSDRMEGTRVPRSGAPLLSAEPPVWEVSRRMQCSTIRLQPRLPLRPTDHH